MDSTVMHINKGNALSWGNPKGTHAERKGNAVTRIKMTLYDYWCLIRSDRSQKNKRWKQIA